MKNIYYKLLILLVGALIISSCEGGDDYSYTSETEVYGCMDQEADNYDQEATVDDASCIYEEDSDTTDYSKGEVVFYTYMLTKTYAYNVDSVEFYIEDEYIGYIPSTNTLGIVTMSCGSENGITSTLDVGTYNWYAISSDDLFEGSGTFDIEGNTCNKIEIILEDEKEESSYCTDSYEGPSSDPQSDSFCEAAYTYLCVGGYSEDSEEVQGNCDIYKEMVGSSSSCPYCP